jgi:hypothetical protein
VSDRLDKAKAAFADAVEVDKAEIFDLNEHDRKVSKLLTIARTQAALATAEAVEALLDHIVMRNQRQDSQWHGDALEWGGR